MDLAQRLSPHVEEFAGAWAARLVVHLDVPDSVRAQIVDGLASLNRVFLEDHLALLRRGDLETALKKAFENNLAFLRAQRQGGPELRTTLHQLHLSLEISTAVAYEWIERLYAGDPRLPCVLVVHGRLSLHLGKLASEAFHHVRSEELDEALRVASSLLETSRQLAARSASVYEVLERLTDIVHRLVRCDRSVAFLWSETEQAFTVAHTLGFEEDALAEVKQYRFRPGGHPLTDTVLAGNLGSGVYSDGCVSREIMERHGLTTYAIAPLNGSDGRMLGALAAYRSKPDAFHSTDLQILRGVAQNAGLAIENAELVEQLEAAARLKGEFINSMSHEIRTPLHILFGYLEMLQHRHGDDPEDREILDRIRRNNGFVLKLVNTILDIGRIDNGRMPLDVSTFEVGELVGDLHEMFGAHAEALRIEFSCRFDEGIPPIASDRLKVLEILNNLVGNAFKFTPGGAVAVHASASSHRPGVLFEVVDTGIGIDADALDAIFEVFRQVGPDSHGGTGLGLYIVRRLVDLLGGNVSVESKPGEGTAFRVWLPSTLATAAPLPAG